MFANRYICTLQHPRSLLVLTFKIATSSRMCIMNHNWSTTKQRLHPQSVADISRHSVFVRGQDSTMWNIIYQMVPFDGTIF